ncbi:hypothetical protein [Capnocytophaga sp.]|nr:hypothetical protein [Capnocytophaga sp.]MDO5104503.1 hypothetical protein [Capnocytophaga sp.]
MKIDAQLSAFDTLIVIQNKKSGSYFLSDFLFFAVWVRIVA